MELKWLIDFVALVEHGSFSKAAEARYVTQPAFSRRIRALENWLGVSLVERNQYPMILSAAGRTFSEQAPNMIAQLYALRSQLQDIEAPREQINITAQHALAVAFFPQWLQRFPEEFGESLIKVHAENLHDALDAFVAGNSDFLLSYDSELKFEQLQGEHIDCLEVGQDTLVPVSATDSDGSALFGAKDSLSIRYVGHPEQSFFGRIIQTQCIAKLPEGSAALHWVCENALSEALKALVLNRQGMAWIPRSLIEAELASGSLKELEAPFQKVALRVVLYRMRQRSQAPAVESFWTSLASRLGADIPNSN
ncbi:MAG: LysR family transcriptional regulator [Pseudomonadales bacterium]